MKRLTNNLRALFKIPLLLGVTALCLFFFGNIPALIQTPQGVKEYLTLEEAQADIGFKVVLPAYFPNYLTWPPSRISGETRPEPQLEILFVTADRQTEDLLIVQGVNRDHSQFLPMPWIDTVLAEIEVNLRNNDGILVVGMRNNGSLINGIRWSMNGFQYVIVTIHPVQELLKIARSMYY